MKANVSCILLPLVCLLFCSESGAQQAIPGNSGVPGIRAKIVLEEGTEVFLRLAQDLNSKTAKEGELVEFVLTKPVMVGDVVVADAGSRATGTVVHSKTPDFWGNPGEINVRMAFLKAGKTKVPLRGSLGKVGSFRVVVRGGQGVIRQGMLMKALVDADTEIEGAH